MKRYFTVLLIALVLCALASGCQNTTNETAATSSETGTQATDSTQATGATETDATGAEVPESAEKVTTPETIPEDDATAAEEEKNIPGEPTLEGVYASGKGFIAVRNAEDGMCDIIVSIGTDGSDAFLAGIAQTEDNKIVYMTESFAMTLTVEGDKLTVEENGQNNYYSEGFSGVYTRTATDPYSIETRQSVVDDDTYEELESAEINGGAAIIYVDPQGRFTASVPDVFSDCPADTQPDEGVHLTSIDDDVDAVIEVVDGGNLTGEALKNKLEEEYKVEADLLEDGTVILETATEDGGKTVVIYAHVIGDKIVIITYSFDATQDDYFRPLLDQVSINIG